MATPVLRALDFEGRQGIVNLAPATGDGQPIVYEQLTHAIEGVSWKENVRVATQGNINLAAPGASIDGVAMVVNDRVLVREQDDGTTNGIYVWNGAATPMARALDVDTWDELEKAACSVVDGSSSGATYRQTAISGTLGTTIIIWALFGASAPPASEGTAGIAEIATQQETDGGTDDARVLTPRKLANWAYRARRVHSTIGDGSSTLYTVTHNLGTRDVVVYAHENGGLYREIFV